MQLSQPASLDALAALRVVDLTQPLGPDTILWPGSTPFSATVVGDVDSDGFYARDFAVPEHAGTHFDAPAHVAGAGATVDEVPADLLVRPAVRLDVRGLCAGDPAFTLSAAQIESIEAAEGAVPAGSVVLVCTGWDAYVEDRERYVGPGGATAFPGIGEDAARLLVERGVAGVGIDTLGVDPGHVEPPVAHYVTLPAGVWHLEGLVALDEVPPRGAWLVVAPLRLAQGSGAPARVYALVPG